MLKKKHSADTSNTADKAVVTPFQFKHPKFRDPEQPWSEDTETVDHFVSPESSTIHSSRYYPNLKLLIVLFKFDTGGIKSVYTYQNFPFKEWAKFVVAESKGAHFNAYIRPIYHGEKV